MDVLYRCIRTLIWTLVVGILVVGTLLVRKLRRRWGYRRAIWLRLN